MRRPEATGSAPLRPLRRPVRPRDADAGARRARGGVADARATTRASGPSSTSCCATTSAGRRRCTSPQRLSRGGRAPDLAQARGPATTPARTRSTTPSARRCSPGAWASTRIIAETGAGQHGVATATACALLGLECVVYMGAEDIAPPAAQRAAHGAARRDGRAGRGGTRTLKEATNEAIRDWVTNVGRHALHHRLGRRPGSVPGDRARPAARDRRRGARADARARGPAARRASSRASAAARTRSGSFAAFVDDAGVELVGVEAAGEGLETGRHGAPLTVGGRPRRAARRRCSACCRTTTARSPRRTRSRPASTTPASGPSTRSCGTPAARATSPSPTSEALAAFARVARLEGIIPALETAHALAWLLARAGSGRRSTSSACRAAATRTSPRSWRARTR